MSGSRRRTKRSRGFALIIAVSLLALLVMVLVAMATLTRVETSVGVNTSLAGSAQQNALYALNVALGELQRHAGPDTRITATAEIMSGLKETPYLTGVWNSQGEFRTWLISGNEMLPDGSVSLMTPTIERTQSDTSSDFESLKAPANMEARKSYARKSFRLMFPDEPRASSLLVGPYTAGHGNGAESRYIVAPLVELEGPVAGESVDKTIGRYAWWVGDEGVKASITETDRHLTNSAAGDSLLDYGEYADAATRARIGQLALPRHRYEDLLGIPWAPFDDPDDPSALDTVAQLERVMIPSQLAFARFYDPNDNDAPRDFESPGLTTIRRGFHDITTYSRGVIADSKNGGLKYDLSNPSGAIDTRLRGFLGLRPDGASTATRAVYPMGRYPEGAADGFRIAPVLTEAVVYLKLEKAMVGNLLQARWGWAVELWNPYNATIHLRPMEVLFAYPPRTAAGDSGSEHIVDFGRTISSNNEEHPEGRDALNFRLLLGGSGSPAWAYTLPADASLRPGEIRRFEAPQSEPPESALVDVRTNEGNTISISPSEDGHFSVTLGPPLAGPSQIILRDLEELNEGHIAEAAITSFTYGFSAETSQEGTAATLYLRFRLKPDIEMDLVDPRGLELPHDLGYGPGLVNGHGLPGAGEDFFTEGNVRSLFDIARQDHVSVGSLQHFNFSLPENPGRPFRIGSDWAAEVLAPPLLTDETGTAPVSENQLFDRTFFSSIPSNPSPDWTPGINPLPNTRIEIYTPPSEPIATRSDFAAGGTYAAPERRSARLLVGGAFNVNSTSVDAWRAIVAGTDLDAWVYADDDVDTGSLGTLSLEHAYFRFANTAQTVGHEVEVDTVTGEAKPTSVEAGWRQGIRGLSSAQVAAVSEYIAEHVGDAFTGIKVEGEPFGSIADFVSSGIVRDAMDPAKNPDPAVDALNTGLDLGSPSYLTQADLISAWAPFLQARSDTFLIRAYGESINAALDPDGIGPEVGPIEARAWCEAVVQRVPEYVDTRDQPWESGEGLNGINQTFGRRFVITSFRWLSPDDI